MSTLLEIKGKSKTIKVRVAEPINLVKHKLVEILDRFDYDELEVLYDDCDLFDVFVMEVETTFHTLSPHCTTYDFPEVVVFFRHTNNNKTHTPVIAENYSKHYSKEFTPE